MPSRTYIGRQPILNRHQQLIGYELLFRDKEDTQHSSHAAALQADTQVLLGTLNDIGTRWLIGDKLAFINVGEDMLSSELIELLPTRRVVLEVSCQLDNPVEAVSRLRHLRTLGFGIALDRFEFNANSPALLELAHYVKLDVQQDSTERFQHHATHLKSYPVQRLAERVETREQFQLCRELGLDGYQGYYFAKPETLSTQVIQPSFQHILQMLNLLRSNAELKDIEVELKQDVALSFKLLRYVNSAAAGLNTSISSFSHAVTVLGYRKLYRWLTLLLITSSEEGQVPPALQKTAVTRARVMELIGQRQGMTHEQCDNLFITGMFSLLDSLFDMPMERVVENLQLPADIAAALTRHLGPYGAQLRLALTLEKQEMDGLDKLANAAGVNASSLNALHLEALSWVEELGL